MLFFIFASFSKQSGEPGGHAATKVLEKQEIAWYNGECPQMAKSASNP